MSQKRYPKTLPELINHCKNMSEGNQVAMMTTEDWKNLYIHLQNYKGLLNFYQHLVDSSKEKL